MSQRSLRQHILFITPPMTHFQHFLATNSNVWFVLHILATMRSLKQPCNDENQPISSSNPPFTEFSNGLKCQCKALNFSEEIKVLRDKRAANDAWIAREGMERL